MFGNDERDVVVLLEGAEALDLRAFMVRNLG